MAATLEEYAFSQGYTDAERGRLAQSADLERKFLALAHGDYERADALVDYYMQGIEAYTDGMKRLHEFEARNGKR